MTRHISPAAATFIGAAGNKLAANAMAGWAGTWWRRPQRRIRRGNSGFSRPFTGLICDFGMDFRGPGGLWEIVLKGPI